MSFQQKAHQRKMKASIFLQADQKFQQDKQEVQRQKFEEERKKQMEGKMAKKTGKIEQKPKPSFWKDPTPTESNIRNANSKYLRFQQKKNEVINPPPSPPPIQLPPPTPISPSYRDNIQNNQPIITINKEEKGGATKFFDSTARSSINSPQILFSNIKSPIIGAPSLSNSPEQNLLFSNNTTAQQSKTNLNQQNAAAIFKPQTTINFTQPNIISSQTTPWNTKKQQDSSSNGTGWLFREQNNQLPLENNQWNNTSNNTNFHLNPQILTKQYSATQVVIVEYLQLFLPNFKMHHNYSFFDFMEQFYQLFRHTYPHRNQNYSQFIQIMFAIDSDIGCLLAHAYNLKLDLTLFPLDNQPTPQSLKQLQLIQSMTYYQLQQSISTQLIQLIKQTLTIYISNQQLLTYKLQHSQQILFQHLQNKLSPIYNYQDMVNTLNDVQDRQNQLELEIQQIDFTVSCRKDYLEPGEGIMDRLVDIWLQCQTKTQDICHQSQIQNQISSKKNILLDQVSHLSQRPTYFNKEEKLRFRKSPIAKTLEKNVNNIRMNILEMNSYLKELQMNNSSNTETPINNHSLGINFTLTQSQYKGDKDSLNSMDEQPTC